RAGKCKMKNLSPDDRPREKLRSHGAAALGDNELVALVIGHGSRGGDALTMANALLAAHGGLHGLTRCTVDDCRRLSGIGTARSSSRATSTVRRLQGAPSRSSRFTIIRPAIPLPAQRMWI